MRRLSAILLLVALVGLTGSAKAAPAEGTLTLKDSLNLPPDASLELSPQAVLQNETASVSAFSMEARQVRLTVYELRMVSLEAAEDGVGVAPNAEPSAKEYLLKNGIVTLAPGGNASGYFALYPSHGARLTVISDGGAEVTPADYSELSWGQRVQEDSPSRWDTSQEIQGSHLRARTAGLFASVGAGSLKVNGLNLLVEAEGARFVVDTGYVRTSPAEAMWRWVYAEFDNASISWQTGGEAAQVASRSASAEWEGFVSVETAWGQLRSPEGEYLASDGPTTIEGDFQGTLTPFRQGTSMLLALKLSGDLGSTDMRFQGSGVVSSPTGAGGALAWIGLSALALAVVAGGALAYPRVARKVRERRREKVKEIRAVDPDRVNVEDMAAFAEDDLDEGRFHDALMWIRRARRIAPTSVKLRTDEAFCLHSIGDYEGALAAYREVADNHPPDGEADFFVALLMVILEQDEHEAERRFVKALERTPRVVEFVMLYKEQLEAFLERPAVERAVKTANRRLDEWDKQGE